MFGDVKEAVVSPLARSLFQVPPHPLIRGYNATAQLSSPHRRQIPNVTNVFFGADYVSVTAEEPANWDVLKPNIFASIMDFYHSGQPLVLEGASLMPTVRRATTPSACAKIDGTRATAHASDLWP